MSNAFHMLYTYMYRFAKSLKNGSEHASFDDSPCSDVLCVRVVSISLLCVGMEFNFFLFFREVFYSSVCLCTRRRPNSFIRRECVCVVQLLPLSVFRRKTEANKTHVGHHHT